MASADDDHFALNLLVQGFKISRMIRLVADLKIADQVAPNETCRIADLATACGVLSEPLQRTLRAPAAFKSIGAGYQQ
jgi:hypothetical protein